ncbi:MAG TPA: hypothetical protein VNZ94_00500 [Xanthobacteraceae bacterium]|nr:hypothetical protein [Xanthobacteraceae bacterium]
MSETPIILHRDRLDRSHGQAGIEVQQRYLPPCDPEEKDPHAAWDMMVAKAMQRVLTAHYRGHFWETYCSRKDGIAWITIPLLLGNWKWVFKLSEDITPEMIIRAGGEILERFNIPRSGLDLPAFLNAKKRAISRANHALPE